MAQEKATWKDALSFVAFWIVMLAFWAAAAVIASVLETAGCLVDSPIGPG